MHAVLWSNCAKYERCCENMSSSDKWPHWTLDGFIKNENVEVDGPSRNPQLLELSGISIGLTSVFPLGLPPPTHLCLSRRIQPLHLLARSNSYPCVVNYRISFSALTLLFYTAQTNGGKTNSGVNLLRFCQQEWLTSF